MRHSTGGLRVGFGGLGGAEGWGEQRAGSKERIANR